MATFAEKMQTTASRLATAFGEDVVLTRVLQTPGPNPFDPVITTPESVTVSAAVTAVADGRVDGEAIQTGDLVCLISGADAPEWVDVTTSVERGGKTYKVATPVKRYPAQGQDIAFELVLRR